MTKQEILERGLVLELATGLRPTVLDGRRWTTAEGAYTVLTVKEAIDLKYKMIDEQIKVQCPDANRLEIADIKLRERHTPCEEWIAEDQKKITQEYNHEEYEIYKVK